MYVLRTLISLKSYLVTVCQRTGAFHIFLLLQCLFVLRALCNLTVSDWLGNQPRSFPAHSLNKQMLVSAHLLAVVSLYEEPLPKRKSSSSHKQITFPYHYLEKETDVKYDFDNWLAVRLFILSKPQNMLLGSCRKFIQNFCISSTLMHKPQMKCATPTYCKMVRISPKTCVILRE